MAARRTRPRRLLAIGLCLVAAATGAATANPVAAVDEDLLAGPFVDVAFVSRGDGSSPDVLTLDVNEVTVGNAHVALLRRDAVGWSQVAEATVPIAQPFDEGTQPWFVELDNGRFAILTTSQNVPAVVVVPLTVDPGQGRSAFTIDGPVVIEGNVANAGAADVDGDGVHDLIVSTFTDGDENGRCVATTIHVLGRDDAGWQRSDHLLNLAAGVSARVAGAAFGKFDGRPGDDMLAHLYDTCGPATAEGSEPHHLVAIRLTDGAVIVDMPSSVPESSAIMPSAPRVVDVDGDGRDEAVVRGFSEIAIIDPSDGWKRLTIDFGEVQPLAVQAGSTGAPSGVVTWLDGPDPTFWSARIQRVGRSLVAGTGTPTSLPDLLPETWLFSMARLRVEAGYLGPANVASIDLDHDGCPELLLPAVIADCLGTGPFTPGPAWLNSRPLGLVGTTADPRLLVAEGIDWYLSSEGPYPPTPSEISPGSWREGWSPPFFLAEVGLPLAARDPSTLAPEFGSLTDKDGSLDLRGSAEARLLLRVSPLRSSDASIDGGMTTDDFLTRESTENEFVHSRRLPAAGVTAVNLVDDAGSTFGDEPQRWVVAAVVLDERGEPSAVTRATVVFDTTAPLLTLDEAPLLSPPWPFEATITGTSEPGATVRLGDGPPVVADPTGAFELTTRLAPWPQTLEAVAVDPSGNRTPASITVMGGIDLRGFPWPAIAAVAILVAVLLSSLRGTRRVRSVPSIAVSTDDGGDLVIEELEPGSVYRRD